MNGILKRYSLGLITSLLFASMSNAGEVLFVSDSTTDSVNIPAVLSGGGVEEAHASIAGANYVPAAGAGFHNVTVIRNDYATTGGTFGLAEGGNAALAGSLVLSDYCSVFWSASGPYEPNGFTGGLGADGGLHNDAAVFTNLDAYIAAGGFVFVTGHDSITHPTDMLLAEFVGGVGASAGQQLNLNFSSVSGGNNALTLGPVSIAGRRPGNNRPGGINQIDQVQEQDYVAMYDAATTLVVADYAAGLNPSAASWSVRHPGGAADEFVNKGHVAYVANGVFLYEDLPAGSGVYLSDGEDPSWLNDFAYNGVLQNFAANSCIAPPFDATENPVADDQAVTTLQDVALDITLTGSDPNGDALTFAIETDPTDGTLTGVAPDLTYTPDGGFLGNDGFTFITSDASRSSYAATVSITVRTNTAPVSDDDTYQTDEDNELVVAAPGVLDGDTDDDNDPMTVTLVNTVANGALNLADDGSFTYTPNADYCGAASFTYVANDGYVDGNEATVDIDVACVNDPPILIVSSDSQTVKRKKDIEPVLIGATDVDSILTDTSLTVAGVPESLVVQPAVCSLVGQGSQCGWSLSGKATDRKGTYDVTFTVDDGAAVSNTATAETTFLIKKSGAGATGLPGILFLMMLALLRTRRYR